MFSTGFKGVGLHYTAFATAICGDSRPTAASHGVSRRKKFAVEANVESRVKVTGRVENAKRISSQVGFCFGTIEAKANDAGGGRLTIALHFRLFVLWHRRSATRDQATTSRPFERNLSEVPPMNREAQLSLRR